MKNAILVACITRSTGTSDGYKNIGDYIQSLAGVMFFDKIDEYINRDKLDCYKSESGKIRMIMNAWYMHSPDNWPPSDDIFPLLISIHINPNAASRMLTLEGINYLTKYGPVGCRDKYTETLLNQHNIPCYFSGCLTLTLGEKYKTSHKENHVLIVDPYFEYIRNAKGHLSVIIAIKSLFYGIIYYKKVKKLRNIFNHSDNFKKNKRMLQFLKVSAFYKTYSSYFDDNILLNAEYITHIVKVGNDSELFTEKAKINYAENLVCKYAEASLVITSRIHCALPCIGLETPVIFITNENGSIGEENRLDGLVELFNVMKYKNFCLTTDDNTICKKINMNTIPVNKKDYISIKDDLLKKCYEFASK